MLERTFLIKLDHCITVIKKNEKGIYGSATYKEIKELKEEGIDTYMFPWIDKKDN